MGSLISKPARSAVGAASRRQYPRTPSPSTTTSPQEQESKARAQGPTYHPKEQASTARSAAIDLDGRDPDFAASLRSIGPVTPNPTFSNSSAFNRFPPSFTQPGQAVFPQATNPALLVMSARQRIAKAAELEAETFGKQSHAGREFLDTETIRQALSMRDREGLPAEEIERRLRLKEGVVGRLGKKGVVALIG